MKVASRYDRVDCNGRQGIELEENGENCPLVGKYVELQDAYISVVALKHSVYANDVAIELTG